jgi:hypothetical protein
MMTFPRELQDILGFKVCKSAGHIFAQDPRTEMTRHYTRADELYLEVRNSLHAERLARPSRPATY